MAFDHTRFAERHSDGDDGLEIIDHTFNVCSDF
jgi:hypothetical protein